MQINNYQACHINTKYFFDINRRFQHKEYVCHHSIQSKAQWHDVTRKLNSFFTKRTVLKLWTYLEAVLRHKSTNSNSLYWTCPKKPSQTDIHTGYWNNVHMVRENMEKLSFFQRQKSGQLWFMSLRFHRHRPSHYRHQWVVRDNLSLSGSLQSTHGKWRILFFEHGP